MAAYEKIYLKDYKPYEYSIPKVDLIIDFFEDKTLVKSTLCINKKKEIKDFPDLVLKGENLETKSILIDGEKLSDQDFSIKNGELKIKVKKESFILETEVLIHPETNTSLEGIYKSDGLFCSQCEAEGFRNITWHPDRPDVLSEFTCKVSGDKEKYPVLLSNGNPVGEGDLENGRHFVKWHDPFPKPSYLFAVVAGDLICIEDNYTTMTGRNVVLRIFTEEDNKHKCGHAMESLKKSMKWDEDVFSREYDLDIYMIVAVRAFNMGAMENKGLNIFNSTYVLADDKSGTDDDFYNIESVVAHEYFHNWTGNRITLANWFQLSLKEGLTVFRDQQFSKEVGPGSVSRIKDVRTLKARQFPEDAGPFAHPVRPESYMEMNNFYTATVYEKGAEIVRMLYNWLGREDFIKGMDIYFAEYDSMAVTCEEFISALEKGSGKDLSKFMAWYGQSGTPFVEFSFNYNEAEKKLTLDASQVTPETPGQKDKKPVPIPVKIGFLGKEGNEMEFVIDGEKQNETVILLDEDEKSFVFNDVKEEPVISLFRELSAPVRFDSGSGIEADLFLMAHDKDAYNKWDSSRRVFFNSVKNLYKSFSSGINPEIEEKVFEAYSFVLKNSYKDKSLTAEILSLPSSSEIIQELMNDGTLVDPYSVFKARKFFVEELSKRFEDEFLKIYRENVSEEYIYSDDEMAKRSLKNSVLIYLSSAENSDFIYDAYLKSDNMTDTIGSLRALVRLEDENAKKAVSDFYGKWKNDLVVMDKWFAIQASSTGDNTFEIVKNLLDNELFSIENPNKVRCLIGVFANNPYAFHRKDGKGYAFVADKIIELSKVNPQVGARLTASLSNWKGFKPETSSVMKENLEKIFNVKDLSKDVYEMVARALDKKLS